jgi:glycosyltransferase involved in cell wall biosynthesis
MNDNQKCSIIMPCYNAMPYLEMAIKSIYAQTYKNWELIIVDDFSTDGTWEFLQRHSDSRIRLFRNGKNYGHSYTKNRCIEYAQGKYIARMDADDISLPIRLEKQIKFLEENPSIDVCGCGSYKVNKDFRLIKTNFAVTTHSEIVNLAPLDIRFVFGSNFQITDGTIIARSEWFKKYKYDEKVRWSEDFDLMIRGLKDSLYANINEPLYIYLRVGTTAPIKSQIKSIKQRVDSLFKYRHNLSSKMLVLMSFISLLLRPIFIIMTGIFHKVVANKILSSTLPPQVKKEVELIKNMKLKME